MSGQCKCAASQVLHRTIFCCTILNIKVLCVMCSLLYTLHLLQPGNQQPGNQWPAEHNASVFVAWWGRLKHLTRLMLQQLVFLFPQKKKGRKKEMHCTVCFPGRVRLPQLLMQAYRSHGGHRHLRTGMDCWNGYRVPTYKSLFSPFVNADHPWTPPFDW